MAQRAEDWRKLRDPEALLPYLGNPRAVREFLLYRFFDETPNAGKALYEALFYGAVERPAADVPLTADQLRFFRELSAKSNRRLDAVYAADPARPGERVLDAGCGPGGGAFRMAASGARVFGCDSNRAHVGIASELLRRRGFQVPLVRADLLRLPFARETFERIVLADVVEHINDKSGLFREIGRVLKPGGRVIVHTDSELRVAVGVWARRVLALAKGEDPRRWNAAWSGVEGGHTAVVTPQRLKRVMERSGLDVALRMRRLRALTSYVAVGRKR